MVVASCYLEVPLPIETFVTTRGTQTKHRRGIIAEDSEYTRALRSKHFDVTERGQHTFFRDSTVFSEELPSLTRKPYYGALDGAARALLEIHKHEHLGGLLLFDLHRLGDGGASFLAADLELAALGLHEFAESRTSLSVAVPRHDPRVVIGQALDAYRDKAKVLRDSAGMLGRLRQKCTHPLARRLLSQIRSSPTASPVFAVLKRLYDILYSLSQKLFVSPEDLTAHFAAASRDLEAIVRPARPRPPELRGTGTVAQFFLKFHSLLRAVSAKVDSSYRDRFRLSQIGGDRGAVAACDLRKFTRTLEEVETQRGSLKFRDVEQWFARSRAAVHNWWICFGGALSETSQEKGDSFFGAFVDPLDGLWASVLAVAHLNLLQSQLPNESSLLQYRVVIVLNDRSAIVQIIDGVDISPAVNEAFHIMESVKSHPTISSAPGSVLLCPPGFRLPENLPCERFAVGGAEVWLINAQAAAQAFLEIA
jgi:hypothetical protein